MGRFPNIAAAKQKTGAAKGKIYSMYSREIYDKAKKGGTNPEANSSLKRVIEKAKKDQVPVDVIKRAIDKVTSGATENYENVKYEIFGPSGSTVIAECLTDNVNRSVSDVRTALNKCKSKMGVMGSVAFNYDNLCIISFKGLTEEQVLDLLIENNIDVLDMEEENGVMTIYGNPTDSNLIKEAVASVLPNIEFDTDEITFIPKERINITGEDLDVFNRLLTMLDDCEDVANIYHNVNL